MQSSLEFKSDCDLAAAPSIADRMRDYQLDAIRTWEQQANSGIPGTLIRCFTGGGKTPIVCACAELWLARGDEQRVMVIEDAKELASQTKKEMEDWLAIPVGLEMSQERITAHSMVKVIVGMRQTFLAPAPATDEQRQFFSNIEIRDLGIATRCFAQKLINASRRGVDVETIRDALRRFNASPMANHEVGRYSRLYKFDWRFNWLLIFDEAHRHAHHLISVGPLVDWFSKNPNSRRIGITATPRRGDRVSLGHKMFPGVALDMPLYSRDSPCAIEQGWAVPYIQYYISVEGVDFASLPKVGKDFDQDHLDDLLNTEEQLARLCDPLLDLCGDRLTLIFSPSVSMAHNVASYLNARSKLLCDCGKQQWHPARLVGDGAKCKGCGELLKSEQVISYGRVAESVDGSVSHDERRRIYDSHKAQEFQFLSVCNLCREGFNSQKIACVAIFRPVSKAAAYLAEQMRGRGARPLPGLVDGLETADDRRAAIAASEKPNCMIVDLVGTTGLPDCATTLEIYAEGLDDEVIQAAQDQLMANNGMAVEDAINLAVQRIEAERERKRQERIAREQQQRAEAAERARLGAQVRYTATEVSDQVSVHVQRLYRGEVRMATDKQLRYLYKLGFRDIDQFDRPSLRQAGRMIEQLQKGKSVDDVRYTNKLEHKADTYLKRIMAAGDNQELDRIGRELKEERGIEQADWERLIGAGKCKRRELMI